MVLRRALSRFEERARVATLGAAIGCVAGLLIALGLVFAMMGIYESLALQMPRWQSGLIVGAGAVALSGLLLLVFRLRGPAMSRSSSSRRGDRSADDDSDTQDLEDMVELAELIARVATEHRPKGVDLTIAGFVAGLTASQQLKSRRNSQKDSG